MLNLNQCDCVCCQARAVSLRYDERVASRRSSHKCRFIFEPKDGGRLLLILSSIRVNFFSESSEQLDYFTRGLILARCLRCCVSPCGFVSKGEAKKCN